MGEFQTSGFLSLAPLLALFVALISLAYTIYRNIQNGKKIKILESQGTKIHRSINDPSFLKEEGMKEYKIGLLNEADDDDQIYSDSYDKFKGYLDKIQYDDDKFKKIINEIFWIETDLIFPSYQNTIKDIEVVIILILLAANNERKYSKILIRLIELFEQNKKRKIDHYKVPIFLINGDCDIEDYLSDFDSFGETDLDNVFKDLILKYCDLKTNKV